MALKSGTGQQYSFKSDLKNFEPRECSEDDPPSLLMIAKLDAPIDLGQLEQLTRDFWTWQPHCAFKLIFDHEVMFDFPAKCMQIPITAQDYSKVVRADFECQMEPEPS